MPAELYFNQPSNKSIFDFTNTALPPGSYELLGLGLKFCIKAKQPANNLKNTLDRFEHDVRVKAYLKAEDPPEDPDFNPKLYIKAPWWEPGPADEAVETALENFKERLTEKQQEYQVDTSPNLTYLQISALQALKDNDDIIVVEADKNMGVTLWFRKVLMKQVMDEHLSNREVYEDITHQKEFQIHEMEEAFKRFFERHKNNVPDCVSTYWSRCWTIYGFKKLAQFRATAKVHKNPVKLRPVVAKCGTTIEAISKFLDVEFQKIFGQQGELPWCCRDSESFRAEVTQLELPPNARLATFDAVSMYSNIDLDHAMVIMREWFETFVPASDDVKLAPVETLMAALELVMRWNIFEFGDLCLKQLIGTAMGTSCAVFFANGYFGSHEKRSIIPRYRDTLKRVFYYTRFVDDVFLIWLGICDQCWNEMCATFNDFGILKWDCNKPSESVDFLDLTLNIEGNRIITKTYQKPNNPYLYIPPHSAHPNGMIHGIIYSLLRTYKRQNTRHSDFVHFSRLLFRRHLQQGWDQAELKKVFCSALHRLFESEVNPPNAEMTPTAELDPRERLFLHMQFHPKDIPRGEVRQIYIDTCEEVFRDELDIKQFTIAYSKPKTIGNVIAPTKLYQPEGQEATKFYAGELP